MAARMSRSERTLIAGIIARAYGARTLPGMDDGPQDRRRLLDRTAALANDFLDRLPTRPVARPVDLEKLRAAFGGPLPEAPQASIEVVEEPIPENELHSMDELFITGTTTEVVPVTKLDGAQVGNGSAGPVTSRAMQLYRTAAGII